MEDKSISPDFPFQSKYIDVHGSRMHYIDEGTGTPFLFIHGNPTSSYLWRNIIPYVIPLGRAVAVDLIGMGKSDKPQIDYTFTDHARYLKGFIDLLELRDILLVIHDWGSILGFDYAMSNQEKIKGIAFLEALVKPKGWRDLSIMERLMFKRIRHPKKGHKMVIKKNFFVEKILPMTINRKLKKEEHDYYRQPFLTEESRKPLWTFPRELPFDGKTSKNHERIEFYYNRLKESQTPKLLMWFKPGLIIKKKDVREIVREIPNVSEVFIGKGRHFVQEDHPHEIGEAIVNWYQKVF